MPYKLFLLKKVSSARLGERLTPYESEDPSLAITTHRMKEEKGKTVGNKKGASSQANEKALAGPALETHQSHTIEYGVTKNAPHTQRTV